MISNTVKTRCALGQGRGIQPMRWLGAGALGRLVWMPVVALAAVLAAGAESPTASQDSTNLGGLTLEQLLQVKVETVYGASKYVQNVADAPASVTIITEDEIKKYGHRTLGDVLRSAPGLYVSYDRNYSYLGLRGFSRPGDYNSRVLLLVDGHRINDNVYDSAFIGTEFPLDLDLIDRVEIIRGPGSSIYGNNAFFGVINVITKTGRALNGAQVSGEVGSFDSYKGRFSYGKQFRNDVELLVSGSYYDSLGPGHLYSPEFDRPNTHYGVADWADYDRSYHYLATVAYHDFTLEGALGWREKGIPTASYGADFNERRNHTVDEPGFVDLKFHHDFENDWEITARSYYDYYHYYGDYYYSGALNKDTAQGDRVGAEVQATVHLWNRHTVTLGAEFRDNLRQDQANYDVAPYYSYVNDRRQGLNWAFYAQDEYQIFTNLTLNAGVRYDGYDRVEDSYNPRVGLILRPAERTTLKVLYGTAFREPNVYESFYAGLGAEPNPNLRPEKIATYELALEQRLPREWQLGASGYYYRIQDLINEGTDPANGLMQYQNLDRVGARGLELTAAKKWTGGAQGRLSYAVQRTQDLLTQRELSNSPRHLAKLNLQVPLYLDKLYAGAEFQYNSAVHTLRGDKADGFWIVNATLFSQKLARGLEVSASLYNLFDQRYDNPGAVEHVQDLIQQDGRSFRIKLTYNF